MQQTAVLGNFRAYSLSIATHTLSDLSDFPDSRAFYASMARQPLPAPLCSLLYMATCNRIEIYAEFTEGSVEAERDAALAGFSTNLQTCSRATRSFSPDLQCSNIL
jgi:hypothetical protein